MKGGFKMKRCTVIKSDNYYLVDTIPIYELKTKSLIFVIDVNKQNGFFMYRNLEYEIVTNKGKPEIIIIKRCKMVRVGYLKDKNYFEKVKYAIKDK